jgi:hypothetical protein
MRPRWIEQSITYSLLTRDDWRTLLRSRSPNTWWRCSTADTSRTG